MRAADIRIGQTLELKQDNAYGFKGPDRHIYVSCILTKPGYRTPWICDPDGRSFRPSDFRGVVRAVDPETRWMLVDTGFES